LDSLGNKGLAAHLINNTRDFLRTAVKKGCDLDS
jgi:hypothetical protein